MEKIMDLKQNDLSFTNQLVCRTKSKQGEIIWYEYLVEDEQDFRAQVLFYFYNNKNILHDEKHINVINQAIKLFNAEKKFIHVSTPKEEWVKVYWVLYINGFIRICYNRTQPTGMWVFASTKYIMRGRIH